MMLFGILDLAQDPSGWLETGIVKYAPGAVSLYRGPMRESIRRRSPHLVPLPTSSNFTSFWEEEGWGRAWGIIVQSDELLENLWRHFRRFLTVELPDGQRALFRFYDPRILPAYLRSCNSRELAMWFSGVKTFRVERASRADYQEFAFNGDKLLES